jgi:hypothetical protein
MDDRGPAPDSARLRQVREDLRHARPRSAPRDADPARLREAWAPEVRRRRLVEAVDRELDAGEADEADEDQRSPG